MGALRILIVDKEERIRKLLCALLEARAEVEVCGEAAGGKEALQQVRKLSPDVVILDVSAPTLAAGLDMAREIRKVAPKSALLIMSIDKTNHLIDEVRKIGARGFIIKAEAGDTLLSAVDAIAGNQSFFPAET
jgi:DNA-binding NarL/FixJ family response regulator